MENWDEWTGSKDENEESDSHCAKRNKKPQDKHLHNMSTQKELIELSNSRRVKNTRKSKFAEALERRKPVFDPNDKTFEGYLDEYYKLDYEDTIGDMPCRFKYRQVKANDFGLTAEGKYEIKIWCCVRPKSMVKIIVHKMAHNKQPIKWSMI